MALDKDGDVEYFQGSGKKPYILKNVGGIKSCTCPAWCNQSLNIDRRSCKHLKKICGEAAEAMRVAAAFAGASSPGNGALETALKKASERLSDSKTSVPAKTTSFSARDRDRQLGAERLVSDKRELRRREASAKPAPKPAFAVPEEEYAAGVRAVDMGDDEEDEPAQDEDPYDTEEARDILDRAAREGRKLRQDEKTKIKGPKVLLAVKFEDVDIDPTGYFLSEKLDGVRAYWDGKKFVSRGGNEFNAPDWFVDGFPTHPLDGELWLGRNQFQRTISVIRSLDWRDLQYLVFDLPHLKTEPFEERLRQIEALCLYSWLRAVQQDECKGLAHLKKELKRVVDLGGEGLMLRKPGSLYEPYRSETLLKVKPWQDSEARVLESLPGKAVTRVAWDSSTVRSLETRRALGYTGDTTPRQAVEFDLGTGFSDAQRRNPPSVGSVVTFRYTGFTDDGVPKCTSFIGVRDYE